MDEATTDTTGYIEEENNVTFHSGQLSYVGHDAEYIPPHLAFSHGSIITRLDLSFNRIRHLHGLEQFPELEELVLDMNDIGDTSELPKMSKLHTITLNKNRIRDLDTLVDKLRSCAPSLTYLSLLGNEACPNQLSSNDKDEEDYQRYRLYVIYRMPKLKFLDSTPVKEQEKKDAKRMGPFLKVVRPSEKQLISGRNEEIDTTNLYSPLPNQIREDPDHKAIFGSCKYVYYGRHSEGNRFIKNNDL